MATNQLQATIEQVQQLTFEEQLQLIKYLADKLAASAAAMPTPHEPRQLIYGEFRNSGVGKMSNNGSDSF